MIGHTVWQAARWWAEDALGRPSSAKVAALSGIGVAAIALGTFWFLFRPHELKLREIARIDGKTSPEGNAFHWITDTMRPAFEIHMHELARNEGAFDIGAYNWIVTHTRPSDLFVTRLNGDAAAFVVNGAGRRVVAMPELFSNPYVNWASRAARQSRFIAAISGPDAPSRGALCDLLAETGSGNTAFFLLPNEDLVDTGACQLVWQGDYHSLYRVEPVSCGPNNAIDS